MSAEDSERGYQHMIDLQSLIKRGNWPTADSRALALLLCLNVLRIFEARRIDKPESQRLAGNKRKLEGDDDQAGGSQLQRNLSSSLNPAKFARGVKMKKPRPENQKGRITNGIVATKDEIDAHGGDWRKYGAKKIKTQKHPRDYYRCKGWHEGCPATKQVMQIDSEDNPPKFEVRYINEHTCENPHIIATETSSGDPSIALSLVTSKSIACGEVNKQPEQSQQQAQQQQHQTQQPQPQQAQQQQLAQQQQQLMLQVQLQQAHLMPQEQPQRRPQPQDGVSNSINVAVPEQESYDRGTALYAWTRENNPCPSIPHIPQINSSDYLSDYLNNGFLPLDLPGDQWGQDLSLSL